MKLLKLVQALIVVFIVAVVIFRRGMIFVPINQHRLSRKGTFVVAIRVLLADDSEDILAELREDLSKEFDIVGTARNGEEAVQAVLHVDPDVLVIDIAMPVLNGIQASSRVARFTRALKSYSSPSTNRRSTFQPRFLRGFRLRYETATCKRSGPGYSRSVSWLCLSKMSKCLSG